MNPDFWAGRKVFITGHTGFKGAWLCMLLRRLGASITGFSASPPTEPSLFALARLNEIVTDIHVAVKKSDAPIVIHMAGQSLVRESYRDPTRTYATNVMGTVNLLEAVRSAGDQVRAAVVVTSDKCYENNGSSQSYDEARPLGGHDPYSSSKGCAELITSAYRASYFAKSKTAVATARSGNVIGGGDWATDRLLPDMIKAFAAGKSAIIRNPQSVRPWQFVLEPLSGYLALAERLMTDGQIFAEPFNFGPKESDCRSVQWIADCVMQNWGENARWEWSGGDQPHEANCLKLDAGKARSKLGWIPRTDLSIALQWTVDWYKNIGRGEDERSVSERQIELFIG